MQGEIAEAVVTAIRPAVGDAEQQRVLRKTPNSLSAWEAYQRGLWQFSQYTPDTTEQARQHFRLAAAIDPGFAAPHSAMAITHLLDALNHGSLPIFEAGRLAEVEARKAITIDPNDSDAHSALCHALFGLANLDLALEYADRALKLNPNSARAHALKGSVLIWSGRFAEGREEAFISLRLNPRQGPGPTLGSVLAASYYFERDYISAVATARRFLADNPAYAPPRRILVAALGQLGRNEEAAAALRDLLNVAPRLLDASFRDERYIRAEDQEHLLAGLRKAGWEG